MLRRIYKKKIQNGTPNLVKRHNIVNIDKSYERHCGTKRFRINIKTFGALPKTVEIPGNYPNQRERPKVMQTTKAELDQTIALSRLNGTKNKVPPKPSEYRFQPLTTLQHLKSETSQATINFSPLIKRHTQIVHK